MQKHHTRTVTLTADDILAHRQKLFDVEIILNQFTQEGIYNLEPEELIVVAQALAKQAKADLMSVCEWLENVNDEAEDLAAA